MWWEEVGKEKRSARGQVSYSATAVDTQTVPQARPTLL